MKTLTRHYIPLTAVEMAARFGVPRNWAATKLANSNIPSIGVSECCGKPIWGKDAYDYLYLAICNEVYSEPLWYLRGENAAVAQTREDGWEILVAPCSNPLPGWSAQLVSWRGCSCPECSADCSISESPWYGFGSTLTEALIQLRSSLMPFCRSILTTRLNPKRSGGAS